jgi:molybdate transport system ATP-binding protein
VNRFELSGRYPGFELEASAAWDARSVALFGASGSGKSTVLEALAGLRPEVSGVVELGGRRLDGLEPRERRIGWVPQDAALFPHMTVRENLEFAVASRSAKGAASVLELAQIFEVEPLLERGATELSGGERQRVAIARALASGPEHLLLDEPLASIDRPLRSRLLPFLESLPERTGVPLFVVTHDPLEVLALAQHVLVIEGGRVVASGDPRGVFASAASFGALQALGAENRFDVRVLEPRGGTTIVETSGGARLSMVRVEGFPSPKRVAIRAEDVMLAEQDPGKVSAQNVFAATVADVEAVGEQVLVDLDGFGERWRVKVTQTARKSLKIEPGRELVLLVKAHAIVPIA